MSGKNSEIERAISGGQSLSRVLRDDPLETIRRDLVMFGSSSDQGLLVATGRIPAIEFETVKAAAEAHKMLNEIAKPYGGVAEMTRTFAEQHRMLNEIAKPYGGIAEMTRNYAEQHRHMSDIIEAMGGVDALRRMQAQHWGAALALPSLEAITGLTSSYSRITDELTLAKQHALALDSIGALSGATESHLTLGLTDKVREAIEGTSLKMSVLAGITEIQGVSSSSYDDAIHGLMGDWSTHPGLPSNFWRDRRVREGRYRKAKVDAGLIAAPPPIAVEILVESGLAAGVADDSGTVALFAFGGVAVSIRSSDAEVDAYRAVRAFERHMRCFIARKLDEVAGPKWFKQRVDQGTFEKARETREAALKSGEKSGPLINYTELGHLKDIVLRNDNWKQLFEAVFINRPRFEQDMLILMAVRRPTAHSRIVDSTQMVEALIVMKRLDDFMRDDGAWREAAASEE